MMKKALSLLLALAMVMSMFTVGAFATDDDGNGGSDNTGNQSATTGTESNPAEWSNSELAVSPNSGTIVKNGEIELEATHSDPTTYAGSLANYDFTVSYEWSAEKNPTTDGGEKTSVNTSQLAFDDNTAKKVTLTGKEAGIYTVTVTATLHGTPKSGNDGTAQISDSDDSDLTDKYWKASKEVTITVEEDDYRLQFKAATTTGGTDGGALQTLNLIPGATGTLNGAAKKVEFVKKNTDNTYTAVTEGVTIDWAVRSGDSTKIELSSDKSTVTAKANQTGTSYIQATCTFKGKTYTLNVCKVEVNTLRIEKTITNGSTSTYAGSATTANDIYSAILGNLNSVLGNTTAANNMITSATVTLKVPASSANSVFTLAKKASGATSYTTTTPGTSATNVTLSATDSLQITAKAGSIRLSGEQWDYTVEVGSGSDKKTYSGKLTLKSGFAGTNPLTDSQYAPFVKEEFYLGSVGNSISYVRNYTAENSDFSTSNSYIYSVNYKPVDPSTATLDSSGQWTEHYIGYTSGGVAYKLDVTFTAASYDLSVTAKDGEAPFDFDDFESFVSAVASEQDQYYDVDLDYVTFTSISGSGLKLKNGSSNVNSSTKLYSSNMGNVTLDVTTNGTYTIYFSAYCYTKGNSSSSWTTTSASRHYDGVISLYATDDGDIRYEVGYGDKVTFTASDFLSFLRSESKKSNATVTYVVFNNGQPSNGTLYRTTSNTSSNKLTSSDQFYYDPTTNQKDLGKVTYLASSVYKNEEYSVFIPFTVYGKSGNTTLTKTGTVEIVVNGGLPFTDVYKTDTFYEYIRYCYNHDIIGGYSNNTFRAGNSVTREQLALMLYRMAGSPTDYNKKTLSFTDCKTLGAESVAALKWAVNTKVITGYSDGTFRPKDAVTRQAMLTMVYRFANVCGCDTTVYSSSLNSFKDAAKVSTNMKAAVNWAVENSLVGGNNGYLTPLGTTTRGAAAKILGNFHKDFLA